MNDKKLIKNVETRRKKLLDNIATVSGGKLVSVTSGHRGIPNWEGYLFTVGELIQYEELEQDLNYLNDMEYIVLSRYTGQTNSYGGADIGQMNTWKIGIKSDGWKKYEESNMSIHIIRMSPDCILNFLSVIMILYAIYLIVYTLLNILKGR